jgi:type III secretion protein J
LSGTLKENVLLSTQPPFAGMALTRSLRRTVLGLALLALAGCSQQLFGALDESSANQVVGALLLEGVDARKEAASDGLWRVTVVDSDFARAVQVLKRRNLPPRQFTGLGEVFKKESLVSTPTEERARLIHAMSQELERSLLEMDGVLVARVHPVIPPHDPLNPGNLGATASVLIKHRPGADVTGKESMVRALVAAGVEGLSYENVRVLMVTAEPQPALALEPKVSKTLPPVFWGILGVLLGLLLLAYFALNWRDKTLVGMDELRGRLVRNMRSKEGRK